MSNAPQTMTAPTQATLPSDGLAKYLAAYQMELLAEALELVDKLGQGHGRVTLVMQNGHIRYIEPTPSIDVAPRTPEQVQQVARVPRPKQPRRPARPV